MKALGLDVDVFSPDGQSLDAGQMGELVCKKAFPNMPVCLLHDEDRKRYIKTYFSQIPRMFYIYIKLTLRSAAKLIRCMDTWGPNQS